MSDRGVSVDTNSAEGKSLYVRYNTDANVVNGLKNSSSYELTGDFMKINRNLYHSI